MRSTVSDSSGNPENPDSHPEYREEKDGEERYGAVPVREWVGPDGAGRVTDAWAAADERAGAAGGWAVGDEPGVSGEPDAPPAAGPDSVVDLVLDLVPGEGERERGGSGFGATSASVSVPGPAAGADGEDDPADASGTEGPLVEDSPSASGLLPAPAPESGPSAGADPSGGSGGESGLDPEAAARATVAETGMLVMAGAAAPETPASASESVPVSASVVSAPSLSVFTGEDTAEIRADIRTDPRTDTGRHQAVIANERTASIPVHLLFRDEPEAGADVTALPATVVRRAVGGEQAGVRRPPVPRTPQVRPSTRPAPVADPKLHERPGPALPGWVALLTGLGGIAAAGGVLWWTGAVPARLLARAGLGPRPYDGLGMGAWAALALLATVVLFALGGLSRGRVGYAWVLTLFGQYRGSVRRTGLMWVSPLLLRRRIDVRLRHWRSEPLPAMDANGTALRVVVLVVWRVKDTVRATLGIEDHEEYLREQVEAAMARVLSQLPADAFHEDAHTLRNAEAVGDALTRMLKADCEPVGIEVYSAQPTGIEYAPEVAAAMQRRRIAAIDAKHRDSVLTSVVDAVDDTVNRLTARGLVELDDYERKSLVKDLTVAFYTGRSGGEGA
ncbi:SPFH domain-containing protein [Streptomyces sp. NPDC050392]|uniref:SPFH domain-containing protein n=1 Tax=Streptomyces sp. NPDC050392 TaxID=3155782 RepID=UPI0034213EE7